LVVQALLDGAVGHDVESCVQLHDAEPEGGADAEHGRDDGERVDELAQPAVDLLAEDGLEAGAFVHGQVEPERHEAEQQAVDRLHAEGVQAPVEHGQVERVDRALVVVRVVVAVRAHLVPDRLGHALEGQAHCHAGREQHREPREVRVVRPGLFEAEFDVGLLGEEQVEQEEDPDLLGAHLGPCHVHGDAGLRLAEELLEVGGVRVAHDHEGPDQHCAGREDDRVDCEPLPP